MKTKKQNIPCVSRLCDELRSQLCEIFEPSMQFSIQFSFNFKRNAPLKPIVLYHPRKTKKTQNCPKISVFDQKTAISWSIFLEKKRKTVPHTTLIVHYALCFVH